MNVLDDYEQMSGGDANLARKLCEMFHAGRTLQEAADYAARWRGGWRPATRSYTAESAQGPKAREVERLASVFGGEVHEAEVPARVREGVRVALAALVGEVPEAPAPSPEVERLVAALVGTVPGEANTSESPEVRAAIDAFTGGAE